MDRNKALLLTSIALVSGVAVTLLWVRKKKKKKPMTIHFV